MRSSKFSGEQIAYALRAALRRRAGSGTALAAICRQIGVGEATSYVWRSSRTWA